MKGSEFITLLRKVIREEVRTVVKEELKAIKPLLAEARTVQKPKPTQPVTTKPLQKRTTPIVSIDGALGDILRETAENMYRQPIQDDSEWPDMNGGVMTSQHLGLGDDGFMERPSIVSSGMNAGVDIGSAPFMKDYSKVLKAADQHAQGYRPG
jgi:hypothetical protein